MFSVFPYRGLHLFCEIIEKSQKSAFLGVLDPHVRPNSSKTVVKWYQNEVKNFILICSKNVVTSELCHEKCSESCRNFSKSVLTPQVIHKVHETSDSSLRTLHDGDWRTLTILLLLGLIWGPRTPKMQIFAIFSIISQNKCKPRQGKTENIMIVLLT